MREGKGASALEAQDRPVRAGHHCRHLRRHLRADSWAIVRLMARLREGRANTASWPGPRRCPAPTATSCETVARVGKRAIHLVSVGLGQHADPGAGEDRGEVQRNHRRQSPASMKENRHAPSAEGAEDVRFPTPPPRQHKISDPSCLEYLSACTRWWAAGRRRQGPRCSPGTTSAAWMPRRSDC